MEISRRAFLAASAAFASATPGPQVSAAAPVRHSADPVTAVQIIDRIKANVGIPWMTTTVDNVIGGDPSTTVKGIATTMMATLDVLKRASAAGGNLVITHESTFFSHQDKIDEIANDATYRAKRDFITQNGLVVFHFHDHWHRRKPDGIALGMAREVGWDAHIVPNTEREFEFADRTVLQLSRELRSRLRVRTMRVLGDPAMKVRRALASWGFVGLTPGLPYIARDDVDALVVGETREWELVEYVQDQIASGKKKALIVIGHVPSEQAGMKYCAEWLRSFVTEVPIDFVAADEPFWSPDDPIRDGGRTR
jgi:putative NIF3 family GTP cyclohydrolase 1 type 2